MVSRLVGYHRLSSEESEESNVYAEGFFTQQAVKERIWGALEEYTEAASNC